ncbi:MAG: hypothetical protein KF747_15425 [Nitrospira sp.]|nr:hypothetical protein [Nitrospira sp.]
MNVSLQVERRPSCFALHYLCALVACVVLSGCGIGKIGPSAEELSKQAAELNSQLDSAINDLNANAASFEQILTDLLKRVPDTATFRAEIENVVGNTTGLAQENVQCGLDAVGVRARKLLIRIQEELLKKPVSPPPPPLICQMLPTTADLNLDPNTWKVINISGYGLGDVGNDGKKIQYRINLSDGNTVLNLDSRVSHSSRYHATIDLTGQDIVRALLSPAKKSLIGYWNGQSMNDQGEVSVLAWVPRRKSLPQYLGVTNYTPPHTHGDKDFDTDDDDPTHTRVWASIAVTPMQITGTVQMHARERHGDNTRVEGFTTDLLYTVPDGHKIVGVTPNGSTFFEKDVTFHGAKHYDRPGGEAVKTVTIRIDRDGDEAGSYTDVKVEWRTVTIETEETRPAWCPQCPG